MSVARTLNEENELQLLRDWGAGDLRPKPKYALWGTLGVHIAGTIVLLLLPESAYLVRRLPQSYTRVTPLYLPSAEITQRDPNTQKPAKSFDLASLLPRPKVQIPDAPKSTSRPAATHRVRRRYRRPRFRR